MTPDHLETHLMCGLLATNRFAYNPVSETFHHTVISDVNFTFATVESLPSRDLADKICKMCALFPSEDRLERVMYSWRRLLDNEGELVGSSDEEQLLTAFNRWARGRMLPCCIRALDVSPERQQRWVQAAKRFT